MNDTKPNLRFNEQPLDTNMEGIYLLQFREQGWTVLPQVFEADSVDEYRRQIEDAIRPGSQPWNPFELPDDSPLYVYPARAPRLRSFVTRCLASAALPGYPVLRNTGWIIRRAAPGQNQAHDWHKDGDHEGVSCANGYAAPNFLHTITYLEDMTPEHGPTWVVPRSHRDGRLSPFVDDFKETAFLPNKTDVVVWDPRLWHRAGTRTAAGYRTAAIFNFFGVPVNHGPLTPSPAQRQALAAAQDPVEQVLFGGAFALAQET